MRRQKVLTVPDKDGNMTLVVVPIENFVSTLMAVYESLGRVRVTIMWNKVKIQYAGLPKAAIYQFVSGCIGCQCRSAQLNETEPKQIVETEAFSQVEADLNLQYLGGEKQ